MIGDIGLRAFFQLRKKALNLIRAEKIDFVYILIPSFYTSLLGPYLYRKSGVPYGIDYIDPWVHRFPGSEKLFSRHWWSTQLARKLEPLAVKNAALITGVAEGYYKGVVERNPHLKETCVLGAMPYGGEIGDHQMVKTLGLQPYLFSKKEGKIQLVYAGALLPKAWGPLEACMKAIRDNQAGFGNIEFHFIGTGKTTDDPSGFSIRPLAEKYALWQSVIFEYPARIPYLDVLVHLEAATGVFILGSTEPHYTPSKVYQAVLSGKPVLAVLHEKSQALALLEKTGAGITVGISEQSIGSLNLQFDKKFEEYLAFCKTFSGEKIDRNEFNRFSAFEVTGQLAALLNKIQDEGNNQ